jgi:hypothetical protein
MIFLKDHKSVKSPYKRGFDKLNVRKYNVIDLFLRCIERSKE